MAARYYWVDTLPELRKVLVRVENVTSNKWNSPAGVWIEQFATIGSAEPTAAGGQQIQVTPSAIEAAIEQKYNFSTAPGGDATAAAPAGPGVSSIIVVCRAIKGAKRLQQFRVDTRWWTIWKANPLFDPKGT